jgi:hypothetical protein
MIDLPAPLAVVCHDAGAANIILSWLKASPGLDVRPAMAGPAAALWQRIFADRPLLPSVEDALDGAAALLSGTGWPATWSTSRACRPGGVACPRSPSSITG